MLLALHDRRDAIRDYFTGGGCGRHNVRFFVDSGIQHTVVDTFPNGPCLRGDLFFRLANGHLEPRHVHARHRG